jgi:hypothetical protein
MKIISLLFISLLLISCSDSQIEELAFKKTLEYGLVKLCGESDKACIITVKSQLKGCMKESNWQQYLENEDSDEELNKFTKKFYACIVDAEGNPYFESNT